MMRVYAAALLLGFVGVLMLLGLVMLADVFG